MIQLSVVIPVYCNAGSLERVVAEFDAALSAILPAEGYEMVFVDDGSPDDSLAVLQRLARTHPRVAIVKLARNFGQVPAILAGLSHARGAYAGVCSADGQDPPSLIVDMYRKATTEGYDVAIGTRETRDEPFVTRAVGLMFSLVMRWLAFRNYPIGGFDCFLLSRPCYREISGRSEKSPFLQGQVLWLGRPIGFVSYRRRSRMTGRSKWTIGRKLGYLWNGLVGYSFAPIDIMTGLGLLCAGTGFLYAIVVLIARFVFQATPPGWAALMTVILLVSGVQMAMLGTIGQYLRRIYDEARPRPLFVVDKVFPAVSGAAPAVPGDGAGEES